MKKEVLIQWTTSNKNTTLNMVLLYAHNAKLKGWWDEVNILIWGDSQNLVKEDVEVAQALKNAINDGVSVVACKHCAQVQKTEEALEECGVNLMYTGEYLSHWIQNDKKIIFV